MKSPLQRAFSRLVKSGVLTEHDFTCCGSCGHACMLDREEELRDEFMGYLFYHSQDTSSAVATGDIYLAYGGYDDTPSEAVAAKACNILGLVGIETDWDGSAATRIRAVLKPKDINFLENTLVKQEEEMQMWEAQMHCLRRLLRAWKIASFRCRVARRKIKPHLLEWAYRPGGPACKVALTDLKLCLAASQSV